MNSTQIDLPQLLTVKEACRRLAFNPRTLYREIQRKRFPQLVKIGRMSRVRASDIVQYCQSLPGGANPPSGAT